MIDPIEILDVDDAEPGTTSTLTSEGWQPAPYEEPGDGWRLRDDGSWESPDGLTRSFPLDAPTGD